MFEVTEEKLEMWSEMLADQEFPNVLHNLREHIQTGIYPPSIAHLRGVPSIAANSGYLDKGEVLRLEGMKKEALKRIPENLNLPDFIKQRRVEKE